MEHLFESLSERLLDLLTRNESLSLNLAGERSHFMRVNSAKLRQTASVSDASLTMTLTANARRAGLSSTLTTDLETDFKDLNEALTNLRTELAQLPEDPYIALPVADQKSHYAAPGRTLKAESIADELLLPMQGADITGIYAGGRLFRGHINSAGSQHWFETENFSFDYSLLNPTERMVKGFYAGTHWDQPVYEKTLADSRAQLDLLDRPTIRLAPGRYRSYIAPAGVSDLLDMFSWHGISENAMQTGESAFLRMRKENRMLSPKFSVTEDLSSGLGPRFNDVGELAPEKTSIFANGKLENTLISSRTAKEYGLNSNFAAAGEYLRAPVMQPGSLREEDILATLDTGVYISNLHYLNWSDVPGGRITGMTRYACFWVENGVIQGPIENMRFDDSLYDFFGEQLEAVTKKTTISPNTNTYGMRSLGGTLCPGVLLSRFTFTL